jgi:ribosome biogenesis GTPase A
MRKTHCPGCGAAFQTDSPGEPGFLPSSATGREDAICRRCFRLLHYGRLESAGKDDRRIERSIKDIAVKVDLTVLVVDIFDLEGSLTFDWLKIVRSPVLLALNKIDLLSKKTPVEEVVEAAGNLCRRRLPSLNLRDVIPVSAREKLGLDKLKEAMVLNRGAHHRIGFLGVTNAGKSSLLSRLLPNEQREPTVSNLPGTTQGATRWYLESMDLSLLDTPGFVPGTRLTDIICPECAGRLVIHKRVDSQYVEMAAKTSLMLGGYTVITLMDSSSRAVSVYPAQGIKIHSTNSEKAKLLLDSPPDWLGITCKDCHNKLRWEEREYLVPSGCDFFVSGLGWVAVRNHDARFVVQSPEGVETGVRIPNLIGKK